MAVCVTRSGSLTRVSPHKKDALIKFIVRNCFDLGIDEPRWMYNRIRRICKISHDEFEDLVSDPDFWDRWRKTMMARVGLSAVTKAKFSQAEYASSGSIEHEKALFSRPWDDVIEVSERRGFEIVEHLQGLFSDRNRRRERRIPMESDVISSEGSSVHDSSSDKGRIRGLEELVIRAPSSYFKLESAAEDSVSAGRGVMGGGDEEGSEEGVRGSSGFSDPGVDEDAEGGFQGREASD